MFVVTKTVSFLGGQDTHVVGIYSSYHEAEKAANEHINNYWRAAGSHVIPVQNPLAYARGFGKESAVYFWESDNGNLVVRIHSMREES